MSCGQWYHKFYILREIKYFQTLKKREGKVLTIAERDTVIVGSGRATITLLMGTPITIEDALLFVVSHSIYHINIPKEQPSLIEAGF